MANPFITTANPLQQVMVDPEAQALQRQKQYAAMLLQQNQQPQGQMIGGHYVAPSWTQQLNAAISPVVGAYMMNKADVEQKTLADKLRERSAAEITDALQTLKGSPEQVTYGAGQEGPTKTVTPAVAGNRELTIAKLLKSDSPMAGVIASKLIEQQFKEPKWEKAELTDPKTGNTKQGWVDVNSPNPEATFRQGGEKPAISPENVMKGKFEGWYTGAPTGGVVGQPTGSSSVVPTNAPSASPTAQFSPQNAISMSGLSPQAAIQANKELTVDKLKRQVEYAEKAPAAIQMMGQTINNINDLIGDAKVVNGKVVYGQKAPHAGFESAVGISAAPLSGFIPGTATTDFKERFKQIGGQAFLQAFDTLKGGGQITEIEGAKATAALNRMNLAQSEKEFIIAAREFEENLNKGMELARKRAGLPQPTGQWRVK